MSRRSSTENKCTCTWSKMNKIQDLVLLSPGVGRLGVADEHFRAEGWPRVLFSDKDASASPYSPWGGDEGCG